MKSSCKEDGFILYCLYKHILMIAICNLNKKNNKFKIILYFKLIILNVKYFLIKNYQII